MSATRIRRTGRVEVTVPATPEQVWTVLSDVTRIGEWSHECRTARWLDGASAAAVGARFRGANRSGIARWSRPCTVTALDPARELTYRTHGGLTRDCTEWRFTLEPDGAGTRVVQAYHVLSLPRVVERVILMLVPQHEDRAAALREDLVRLGTVARRVTPETGVTIA